MKEFEDELSPEERQSFASLAKEKTPPPHLEELVLQKLKQSGLVSPPKLTSPWTRLRIGYAVAASIALVAAGMVAGIWWKSTPVTSEGPQFILVLRSSPQELTSPADELARVKEYSAWAARMRKQGSLIGGEKLADETRILKIVDGKPTVSQRHPETETIVGGYFLIKANDYQQAITIAENCPHLKYGGAVEVRRIEQ